MDQNTAILERISVTRRVKKVPSRQDRRSDAPAPEASLLGPKTDIFMIGGASIIVCLLYWMFVDASASTATVAVMAYNLSFIVNFPHFLSSYQLLYGDYRKHILKKKTFFWAAVLSPALIIGALAYGISTGNPIFLGYMAQAMFLSVGWHYVKQIFGVAIVTSAVQKRYFSPWERNIILMNLFSVWALSWVNANQQIAKQDLDGMAYFTLGLPEALQTATYIATGITLAAATWMLVRKYIKTGVRPAYSSLVGFASIYFWYLPTMGHPLFFYFVPFFHSLQYMLFVFAMKRNQATADANAFSNPETQRKVFMRKFWGFLLLATILGGLAFELVPRNLDSFMPIGAGLMAGPGVWYFAFALFINLHHYFIDNVIWRGDNEMLKTYLVQASQKRVQANA